MRFLLSLRHPKLYRCFVNGVFGIVLAKDYDRASRKFWKRVFNKEKLYGTGGESPRFIIEPTFLFSDFAPTKRTRLIGDVFCMKEFCVGCSVENRDFYIPPHDGSHSITRGHGNDFFTEICYWEQLDRLYTFEEAYQYVHGLKFPRPGLEVSKDRRFFRVGHYGVSREFVVEKYPN